MKTYREALESGQEHVLQWIGDSGEILNEEEEEDEEDEGNMWGLGD
jgi:hypothetical protein